ncbi:MAG: UbiD family decarboxylase [Sphingobacteriales bacterium]|nr:MAG: UbiD family decarboxylase [Sphingobacteriales bacterium]
MAYASLEACLLDLEKAGQLVRVKEEVDPDGEMAAVHRRIFDAGGPAIVFENVKGSRFRACSNLFGTLERSNFIFRNTLEAVKAAVHLKNDPMAALRHPLANFKTGLAALQALPLKNPSKAPVLYEEVQISDLPLIKHWPMDGGAFVTLPQVYTEDVRQPGIRHSNIGMYRIQLSGNDYQLNQEIGLHYQLHRGIGVHQTLADARNEDLKVSIFVGGPPAHTVAAVMPLPEGLSETMFAGMLAGRRFRYTYRDGFCISTDADFVITGTVKRGAVKPEGPFGDHLGYYSLQHEFPLMQVHNVYARKNAIWPFTLVGRPPQEDTRFGELIHEITGDALPAEIPGLKEVYAVDAAGVHPVLFAIGRERYTPYAPTRQPAELLTIANHCLGTGQLSLAKYLWIGQEAPGLSTHNPEVFLKYMLERLDFRRDIHFYTRTTIDTLDYSGNGLNQGSKVVLAAIDVPVRTLADEVPDGLKGRDGFPETKLVMPGVVAMSGKPYASQTAAADVEAFAAGLQDAEKSLAGIALIVLCDEASFMAATMRNFLWATFTKSDPATDLYGVGAWTEHKHWGCTGPLVIDARTKPHHAPPLLEDPEIEKAIERLFRKGGSLESFG